MDDKDSAQPLGGTAPSGRRASGWLSWLVLCLVATAALSLVAVHLSPLVKKLGLFAIAYGLLGGWIAAELASRLGLRMSSNRAWAGAVFLVVLAGQIGMAVQSHRLRRADDERRLTANPQSMAVLAKLATVRIADDPSSQKAVADLRRTIGETDTSFAGYLQYRVSEIGVKSKLLAAAIWTVEMTLGSLAAAWLFLRLTSPGGHQAPSSPGVFVSNGLGHPEKSA